MNVLGQILCPTVKINIYNFLRGGLAERAFNLTSKRMPTANATANARGARADLKVRQGATR